MTTYSGKIIRKTPVVPTQQSASGVWTTEDAAVAVRSNSWPVAGVPDPISRSVRLRSSASAYFNRTFSTPTAANTWTYSGWVKRGALGVNGANSMALLQAGSTNTNNAIFLSYNDVIQVNNSAGGAGLTTASVYRDVSAWYHIVVRNNAGTYTVYVNGNSVGSASFTTTINNASTAHYIGSASASNYYLDGYMTEINFIDGQALTPSSFGTTDQLTGAWEPMPYTGTYGANGFYLNFKDNTSTATLGSDYSGNSNNWTANNISLTAGSTYDSMLDVPTPWVGYSATTDTTAVTRGNYATLNPLVRTDSGSPNTLSEGNLRINCTSNSYGDTSFVTMPVSSGKWYAEFTLSNSSYPSAEIFNMNYPPNFGASGNGRASLSPYGYGYLYNGTKQNNSSASAYGSSLTAGDVVGVALDMDNGKVFFSKNGTWQASGDPAAGTNAAFTGLSGNFAIGFCDSQTVSYSRANAGQRPFTYTPPTGFKALCTTNLPTPTIANGAQYFAASTYTGNGSTQSIVNSGNNTTSTTFQPDLVWTKSRANAYNNDLIDSVRGNTQILQSNNTTAEATATTAYSLVSFNSNGYTLGASENSNLSGTSVGWQWKAGGTAVSNTAGTITSSVSANTTAGFSIATYTGTGANATVGHGLGVAPRMMIVKQRSASQSWPVYHASIGAANVIYLDLTNASASSTAWQSTTPTSSVFSIGTSAATNTSSATYVAYCWSEVAGYSKFSSYTGNGSTDGPFVYLGFRPRYVLVKRSDNISDWSIMDTSRNTYNVTTENLYADLSNAADSSYFAIDITSNGFKVRSTQLNVNGGTYIYAAFAETPFNYSNAR